MKRLGIFSAPGTGQLNPSIALGRELQRRGHTVVIFQMPSAGPLVSTAGLGFRALTKTRAARSPVATVRAPARRLDTLRVLRTHMQHVLEFGAAAARREQLDGVIVDQFDFAAGSVAEHLGLPFVTACFSPPLWLDALVPPFIIGSGFSRSIAARVRNIVANLGVAALLAPFISRINGWRHRKALPPIRRVKDLWSPLASVTQLPRAMDFPRQHLEASCYHTGPFHDRSGRWKTDFPWDKLDGRPLVYVSLGTVQNGTPAAFAQIAAACGKLDVQMVLSTGGRLPPEAIGPVASNHLVVYFAPQVELLSRATVAVTHGGLNSTLEALMQGVPLLALPITDDQPGVAARIAWTGVGLVAWPYERTARDLREKIRMLLSESRYQHAAVAMQQEIARVDGLHRAGDIIEAALAGTCQ